MKKFILPLLALLVSGSLASANSVVCTGGGIHLTIHDDSGELHDQGQLFELHCRESKKPGLAGSCSGRAEGNFSDERASIKIFNNGTAEYVWTFDPPGGGWCAGNCTTPQSRSTTHQLNCGTSEN